MARAFAAKGRDLALCARRTDLLDELKTDLSQRYPNVNVAITALDVNDHEQVPKVFAELSDTLGGIDRVIVNAGIGKGAPLGSGKLWANKATIETNLVAALVQIETALQMFKEQGSGHLVLISSVLGAKGVPGVKAAYAASKAGVRSLGESLRAEYASGPINVSVMEPGYIESEMTAKSQSTMFMVDNETGVKSLVAAIEPGRAGPRCRGGRGRRWCSCCECCRRRWPSGSGNASPNVQPRRILGRFIALSARSARSLSRPCPVRRDSGGPARRSSCPIVGPASRRR
jgi:short-subunit dehydrogenase